MTGIGAPRRVFSRSELVDACMPDSDALERTVGSHVSNLRRKLEAAGADDYCKVVRGVGYRLLAERTGAGRLCVCRAGA